MYNTEYFCQLTDYDLQNNKQIKFSYKSDSVVMLMQ
jgi:hypothetical protein